MQIELTAPSCLLLGAAVLDGKHCEVGITLQHPQAQLTVRPADDLIVSGGRADLAFQAAEQFLHHHGLPRKVEVEIELAVPAFMGLGSDAIMPLSVARALAAFFNVPHDDVFALARAVGLTNENALEIHAFDQGGLLMVNDDGSLLRRATITHHAEDDDWVFVLVLPKVADDVDDGLEAQRHDLLRTAVRTHGALVPQGQREKSYVAFTTELWRAVEQNDFDLFVDRSLLRIYANALACIAEAELYELIAFSPFEIDLQATMRSNGARLPSRLLTGLGWFGLIKGGKPSRDLRAALTKHLGYFGPLVMASICDNQGARIQAKE